MRRAKNQKQIRFYLLAFSITIVTLFFAWTRLQNIRIRRGYKKLSRIEQKVTMDNSRLNLEWEQLTDPQRLKEIGKEKFQLQSPRPRQVIVLRKK